MTIIKPLFSLVSWFKLAATVGLLACIYFQYQSIALLKSEKQRLRKDVIQLNLAISDYQQHQKWSADLMNTQQRIHQYTLQQSHQWEQHKHDNPDLKNWADTQLPVDIIRLLSRTHTTSFEADGYLSALGTLHDSNESVK